ncbi:MAG: DUF2752 domain-containing protein [Rhodoferax sp.]|nr:DUF2752 domain-containing protein [Rhodoferax sp.]
MDPSPLPEHQVLAPPERHWRMAAGALLPLGVAAAPAFLALGDLPLCAFKHLTGVDCPLCGGIRTCAALAQGDFYAAWQTNPGLLPLLALAALHSGLLAGEAITGHRWVSPRSLSHAWMGAGAIVLASWIWRLVVPA